MVLIKLKRGGGIVFGETDISDIFIKINLAIRWSKHGGVI